MNKVSVYGSFTQALFFSGNVSIPKYLLTHYKEIGLNDLEMMILIQILCEAESNPYPSIATLKGRMTASSSNIEESLGQLVERKLLTIERYWNPSESKWSNSYSLVGLIEELAELWAIERSQQLEEERTLKQTLTPPQLISPPSNLPMENLVRTFEQELGRPLTQIECQNLDRWLSSHFSEELIIEALRRGVSAGIRNFRYLDSILREWEKKGLKTRAEIETEDAYFQSRQDKKNTKPKSQTRKTTPNKYENFYL
ncbi:DnaD domain-containing protein [Desulfosporosinus sp. BICA1-9]|uniref:DnaD domain-containing protein n=1 Tax=Desulfosporosinus sp. BICA1-9 TaxID=1531958 RepID=UPI00054B1564|nr:DnaD domain protein [Desulfosporosinus sp. BICA1-9]KJS48153.1 MAG: DnaD-like protein [Peptococcaceae bacterium BRH_c23]KJS78381.1 MAG: DnaD-like protein [Desulfosporosinus sp. BICA1-9]HBW36545.1 DnaD domain protein [Desulfosporosinus sp.]